MFEERLQAAREQGFRHFSAHVQIARLALRVPSRDQAKSVAKQLLLFDMLDPHGMSVAHCKSSLRIGSRP